MLKLIDLNTTHFQSFDSLFYFFKVFLSLMQFSQNGFKIEGKLMLSHVFVAVAATTGVFAFEKKSK